MRVLFKIVRRASRATSAFFSHDLTLKRSRDGLRVVLQPRSPAAGSAASRQLQAEETREREAFKRMLAELSALLDAQPGSRQAFRHLTFLSLSLEQKGLRALKKLPLEVMQRALEQFETVVTNWSPVGLATLRSKLAVAIIEREHLDHDAEADAYRTAAVIDNLPTRASLATGVEIEADSEALAAAYAALASTAPLPPSLVEMQGDLGSPSARAAALPKSRSSETNGESPGDRGKDTGSDTLQLCVLDTAQA